MSWHCKQDELFADGPFHWACRNGFVTLMRDMLDKEREARARGELQGGRALVDMPSADRLTPLMITVMAEQEEAFE